MLGPAFFLSNIINLCSTLTLGAQVSRAYRAIILHRILWHIDPLLGKDLRTKETTAVAMQRHDKNASTTIELLLETVLCNLLLGSCNSWTTIIKTGVFFSVVRAEESS
jgi:hypothetical protein